MTELSKKTVRVVKCFHPRSDTGFYRVQIFSRRISWWPWWGWWHMVGVDYTTKEEAIMRAQNLIWDSARSRATISQHRPYEPIVVWPENPIDLP